MAKTYKQIVLDDSPLAFYEFEGLSSTTSIPDSSGNGHTGTSNSSVTSTSSTLINEGLFFDNTLRISLGSQLPVDINAASNLSFETWFKSNNPSGSVDNDNIIFAINGSGGTGNKLRIGVSSQNGKIYYSHGSDATYGVDYDDNTWHHLITTVVVSTGAVKIYVDGAEIASFTSTDLTGLADTDMLRIGCEVDSGPTYNDYLDQTTLENFIIYDSLLSPARVRTHYAFGIQTLTEYEAVIAEDSPIVFFNGQETSGSTANNLMADENHGTYDGGLVLGTTTGLVDTYAWSSNEDSENLRVTTVDTDGIEAAGEFTLETWIRIDTWDTAYGRIMKIGGDGAGNGFDVARYNTTNNIGILEDTNHECTNTTPTADGTTWHHLVVTYDQTNAYVYLDGALTDTIAVGNVGVTGDDLQFGAHEGGSGRHNQAKYSHSAFYDYELTSTQVQKHYVYGPNVLNEYEKQIIEDGALHFWPFQESSGSTFENIFNPAKPLTLTGGSAAYETGDSPISLYPDSIRFGGNHPRARTTAIDTAFMNTEVSAEFYFKVDNWNSSWGGIFSVGTESGGTCWQLIRKSNTDAVAVHVYNAEAGNVTISQDVWYHAVMTKNGTAMKLYLDGQLVIDGTATTTIGSDIINIGGRDTSEYANVNIMAFSLYDTELTGLQVQKHYEQSIESLYGIAILEHEPDTWLKLNESATPALDSSGNDHTITTVGTVTFNQASLLSSEAQVDGGSVTITPIAANTNYLQYPDAAPPDDFTFICDVYRTSGFLSHASWYGNTGILANEQAGVTSDFGIVGVLDSGNHRLGFGTGLGGSDSRVISNTDVPLNTWCQIAVTRNSTTGLISFYIDGAPAGTGSENSGSFTSSGNMLLGRVFNGVASNNFPGRMQNAAIFAKEMTATEISDLYTIASTSISNTSDITTQPNIAFAHPTIQAIVEDNQSDISPVNIPIADVEPIEAIVADTTPYLTELDSLGADHIFAFNSLDGNNDCLDEYYSTTFAYLEGFTESLTTSIIPSETGGQALDLTTAASRDVVETNNFVYINAYPHTVDVWIKTGSTLGGGIIDGDSGSSNIRGVAVRIESDGTLSSYRGNNTAPASTDRFKTSSSFLSTNTTYHLTFVEIDHDTSKLYVNGVEETSDWTFEDNTAGAGSTGFVNGQFGVAEWYPTSDEFVGTFDNIAIFKGTQLTALQIQNLDNIGNNVTGNFSNITTVINIPLATQSITASSGDSHVSDLTSAVISIPITQQAVQFDNPAGNYSDIISINLALTEQTMQSQYLLMHANYTDATKYFLNPEGYFETQEASGTLANTGANSNIVHDSTFGATIGATGSGPFGYDKSISFDADSERIVFDTSDIAATSADFFSTNGVVSFWAKIDGWTGSNSPSIVQISDNGNGTTDIKLGKGSVDASVQLTFGAGSSVSAAITLGEWYHFLVARGPFTGGAWLYINGEYRGQALDTYSDTYNTVTFGATGPTLSSFDGQLSHISISETAYLHPGVLSRYQYSYGKNLWDYENALLSQNPRIYFPLNEGSGGAVARNTDENDWTVSNTLFNGSPQYGETGPVGPIDYAVRLQNDLDYLYFYIPTTNEVGGTGQVALESWIKINSFTDSNAVIMGMGSVVDSIRLRRSGTTNDLELINDDVASTSKYTVDSDWHHYILGYDADTDESILIVDGIEEIREDISVTDYAQGVYTGIGPGAWGANLVADITVSQLVRWHTLPTPEDGLERVALAASETGNAELVNFGTPPNLPLTPQTIESADSTIVNLGAASLQPNITPITATATETGEVLFDPAALSIDSSNIESEYTEHTVASLATPNLAIAQQVLQFETYDPNASNLAAPNISLTGEAIGFYYTETEESNVGPSVNIPTETQDIEFSLTQDNHTNVSPISLAFTAPAPQAISEENRFTNISSINIDLQSQSLQFDYTGHINVSLISTGIPLELKTPTLEVTRDTDDREVFRWDLGIKDTLQVDCLVAPRIAVELSVVRTKPETLGIQRNLLETAYITRRIDILTN